MQRTAKSRAAEKHVGSMAEARPALDVNPCESCEHSIGTKIKILLYLIPICATDVLMVVTHLLCKSTNNLSIGAVGFGPLQ